MIWMNWTTFMLYDTHTKDFITPHCLSSWSDDEHSVYSSYAVKSNCLCSLSCASPSASDHPLQTPLALDSHYQCFWPFKWLFDVAIFAFPCCAETLVLRKGVPHAIQPATHRTPWPERTDNYMVSKAALLRISAKWRGSVLLKHSFIELFYL